MEFAKNRRTFYTEFYTVYFQCDRKMVTILMKSIKFTSYNKVRLFFSKILLYEKK